MFCENCGKEIDEKAFVCLGCGVKTNSVSSESEDGPIGTLGLVCFLWPLIGLILYLVWKESKPKKASGAGKAALWGVIFTVIIIFLFILLAILMS